MIVYKITNKLNEKIYVGSDTKNDPHYLGSGAVIAKVIKKYGTVNFEKEILEECKDEIQLKEREYYWIDKLNSADPDVGYNIIRRSRKGGITNTEQLTTFYMDSFLHQKFKVKCAELNVTTKTIFNKVGHLFTSSSEFRDIVLKISRGG